MADSSESLTYAKLPRNTVNRYGKPRGRYDAEMINTIVNTSQVLHVSFPVPDDPFPAMLPMLGFVGSYADASLTLSDPLDLYLHGYISSRLMRLGKSASVSQKEKGKGQEEEKKEEGEGAGEGEGEEHEPSLPLTIAATHLDGLVLALTPNHHSYNYRSAVIHGHAVAVADPAEKLWAMEHITNGVVPERWAHARVPPTRTEMTSTQILRVRIVDASAKVRAGPPGDDRRDMRDGELRARTWIGVVPTWMCYGEPVASPENRCGEVPEHISSFVRRENEAGERNALAAAKGD
ncbi:uncharacterized protein L3040_000179 [Drepanopeziza brunnea f. sp. 'multigermtubi']|uniref:Flavin-nucleotide-binding protein n=1 Tax=Marssonina brunnea f. sp. multigermtubi (strain MB_m1) TaxID=1072389 RepID=K1WP13_MARBU|nr:flavin-nucleotide-binding protein [Drepanopeziza brunnea f. sp. 'multigermtubi' MB_m1]EKD14656.1 flavin-nucleotide-binding protein [Drepanopeziza brunnea f. sp. 'multigermtubi' MB_m1]KAJ5053889.1 hypothetical protein L3040_000179 [Drepanopeziza brunnea f. sp. 'multigermtubi']